MAAKRATAADLAHIEQAYLGMERNLRTNLEAWCEADLKLRQWASAQSRPLSAHRAVLDCVRMRDADGARAATVALLEIAARDLDAKLTGAHVSPPGPATSRKGSG